MIVLLPLALLLQATAAPPANRPPPGDLADYLSGGDYPAQALDLGEEGTVGFIVTVAANGRVTACQITQSSGHAHLDAGTCRLARQRLRFNPAHGQSGAPVAARSREFRITWTIPGGSQG